MLLLHFIRVSGNTFVESSISFDDPLLGTFQGKFVYFFLSVEEISFAADFF